MSNSLRPHESQHARPPCPSPSPRVHSNSCPLSWWCHPAISSSVVPFSSCTQSLPASGSFPMSQLLAWGGQSIGVSASASVLPMNTQDQPVHPKGDQSWVFIEGLTLRLKLQYSGHLMWRVDSLEKTLMLRGTGGRRRRGRQRMRWLDGITDSMDVSVNSRSWWWTGRPGVLRFMGSQRVGHDWATDLIWSVLSQGRESTRKWHKIICGWQNYFISWLLWWLNEWTYL